MVDEASEGAFFPVQDMPFRGGPRLFYERFSELRESMLFDLADGGLTGATLVAYWGDLESLMWWGAEHSVDILQPRPEDIDGYLAELRAQRYSRNTVARRITAFRHFYRHLADSGIIEASPMPGIHQRRPRPARPPAPSTAGPRLTAAQRRRMLAAAEDVRDRAVLAVLFCGVTVTELSRATVADLRPGPPPSVLTRFRDIRERVPVTPQAVDAVRAYLAERPGHRPADPLVLDHVGGPIDRFSIGRLLNRVGKRAGIRTVVSPARLPHRSRTANASSHTSSTDR